jgi:hypothetical protein
MIDGYQLIDPEIQWNFLNRMNHFREHALRLLVALKKTRQSSFLLKDTRTYFEELEAQTKYHQMVICIVYLTELQTTDFFAFFPVNRITGDCRSQPVFRQF